MGSKVLKPQRRLSSYGIDKEKTIHLTLKVVKASDEEVPLTLMESGDEGQPHLLQVRRTSSVAQVSHGVHALCTRSSGAADIGGDGSQFLLGRVGMFGLCTEGLLQGCYVRELQKSDFCG
ncbi:ubiquitin D isoform X1 [Saimiri boliviensis]|uniref:ubiquitin D isoform X1 n=1 Tax=Saimiri boliviensis TaxID=27679 RepID=UPI003D774486